jgi:hypothetical protein
MTTYFVRIPLAGSITIEVDAESEDGAKQAAWSRINEHSGDAEDLGDLEYEYLSKIISGNVCHAPCNEIEVSE